jgi:hypothetical protein
MTHPTSGPYPPAPAPQGRPRKTWPRRNALLLAGGTLVVGAALGAAGASSDPESTKAPQVIRETETVTVSAAAPPAPAAKTATVSATPPAPAAAIDGDGTYTVGPDIPAGTYRVTEKADGDCYWSVTRTGSNGSDIIDNNVGGGFPRVVVKVGQDFTTQGCGSWAKV